jgi:hypothetical protein
MEKLTQMTSFSPFNVNQAPTPQTKRFITKTICRHAAIMADAIKASNLYFICIGLCISNLHGDHQHILFDLHQTNESLRN